VYYRKQIQVQFHKDIQSATFKNQEFSAANTVILPKLNASKKLVPKVPSFRTLWRRRKKLPFTGARHQVGEGSCLPFCWAAIYHQDPILQFLTKYSGLSAYSVLSRFS